MLGGGRNHLVFGRDKLPAWLGLPGGLADGARERLHAPGNLGVGHELGLFFLHIRREGGGELVLSRNRKPSCGGNIGGTGAPGGGSLMSAATDSPLSGAKAAT